MGSTLTYLAQTYTDTHITNMHTYISVFGEYITLFLFCTKQWISGYNWDDTILVIVL